jgi:hypothetical protein
MSGSNGTLFALGADAPPTAGLTTGKFDMGQLSLAMLPTTGVSFRDEPLYAWGRLAVYGAVAAVAWKKSKTVSYVALGALGIGLATSLSKDAQKK